MSHMKYERDSSICIKMRAKGFEMEIKNFSGIKYHKEMKDTWFILDFIVFSLWPYH